ERGRAGAMHHDRHPKRLRHMPHRGEVVGMRVRIDEVTDPHAFASGMGDVTVELADLRIDQRSRAGAGATDEVGLATARVDLLENHGAPRWRCTSIRSGGWKMR